MFTRQTLSKTTNRYTPPIDLEAYFAEKDLELSGVCLTCDGDVCICPWETSSSPSESESELEDSAAPVQAPEPAPEAAPEGVSQPTTPTKEQNTTSPQV